MRYINLSQTILIQTTGGDVKVVAQIAYRISTIVIMSANGEEEKRQRITMAI